jgi:hypothetical protein
MHCQVLVSAQPTPCLSAQPLTPALHTCTCRARTAYALTNPASLAEHATLAYPELHREQGWEPGVCSLAGSHQWSSGRQCKVAYTRSPNPLRLHLAQQAHAGARASHCTAGAATTCKRSHQNNFYLAAHAVPTGHAAPLAHGQNQSFLPQPVAVAPTRVADASTLQPLQTAAAQLQAPPSGAM